jgi:hypothetical protein
MITPITYLIYIAISVGITIFVSRTLSRNGEVYLIDGFNGNAELAKSVNHMLVVGFYLLNIGFVLIRLQASNRLVDVETMIIYLSSNIGMVLVILGAFHFFNMLVVHKIRSAGMKKAANNRSLHEAAQADLQNNS